MSVDSSNGASPSLTPTSESAPSVTSASAADRPVPDPTPVLPGPGTAPSKAQFLAALRSSARPPPSSLHTSTYSVADDPASAFSDQGSTRPASPDGTDSVRDERGRASPALSTATGSGPTSPGFHGRMKRHIYGLSVDSVGSPEGSTLALPYGASRNNSVETFATYNSDDVRTTQDAQDSDQSMLDDLR
ncbi:hypothetical protein K488DRAFT_85422 [Vararia minispora EC-137]|uniref:Uncharacterized protein n=1 Tax=Vararia minispora EC-137 TaxID=1314806 RepID=A0ACB8QNB8_9AGAM|nr:hypothetical protein K488DRAFT_85422 [Vararia minispora EC-137]